MSESTCYSTIHTPIHLFAVEAATRGGSETLWPALKKWADDSGILGDALEPAILLVVGVTLGLYKLDDQ